MSAVLLDHFRPPLSVRRHWHAFHNAWATYLASGLNENLPEGYFAEPNVQFGIEIDIAAFEEEGLTEAKQVAAHGKPQASSIGTIDRWTPPAPSQTIPFTPISEIVEVLVYNSDAGPTLAGAIELVSPANKDRAAHRNAFVAKCQSLLQSGVGLMVVDVVTDRSFNLHDQLMAHIAPGAPPLEAPLYAVSYRSVDRDGSPVLDLWHQSLQVGEALPTMPLWLRGGLCMPVDFMAAYDRTCREQRVPT